MGNSCTSSFLSGSLSNYAPKERGREINRGVVDQLFSHLYFSVKKNKAKGCMGLVARSNMHTVLATDHEQSQHITSGLELGQLGIILAVTSTFSTYCREQTNIQKGLAKLTAPGRNEKARWTHCCHRVNNQNFFHVFFVSPLRLKLFPVWNVHEAHGRSTEVGCNAPPHTQTIMMLQKRAERVEQCRLSKTIRIVPF